MASQPSTSTSAPAAAPTVTTTSNDLSDFVSGVLAHAGPLVDSKFIEMVSYDGFNPVHIAKLLLDNLTKAAKADPLAINKAEDVRINLSKIVAVGLIRGNLSQKGYDKTSVEGQAVIQALMKRGNVTLSGTRGKHVITFGRAIAAFPAIGIKMVNDGTVAAKHFSEGLYDTANLPPFLCFPGSIAGLPKDIRLQGMTVYAYYHYLFRRVTDPKKKKTLTPMAISNEVTNIMNGGVPTVSMDELVAWGLVIPDPSKQGKFLLKVTPGIKEGHNTWEKIAKLKSGGDDE